MLDTLDAAAVRRWCGSGLAALRAHQHEIDELNVYPVPDGDTGTNLVLTLASAQQALALDLHTAGGADPGEGGQTPLGHALRLMARGALLGARGNSGVIVSQILRGMADALASTAAVRGGELARALRSAREAAYAAVTRPVEGTVLSVVTAAAEAAARLGSDDLLAVARAAATAASEALARTPQQLPVLARAGVVDAGGRGLCLLLDALVEVLGGRAPDAPSADPAELPPGAAEPRSGAAEPQPDLAAGAPTDLVSAPQTDAAPADPAPADPAALGRHHRSDAASEFDYEVQYLLDAAPGAVQVMRQTLAAIGDSLVVVGTGDGDPPTWNV
ncbi:MAG TPA: DAK2 domain-containing protein, partial [Actinoplanes sp.]